jgi:predicted O-methyltransferase YrrM
MTSVYSELLTNLYDNESPYLSADMEWVDNGYPHTNLSAELVKTLFQLLPPQFVLELGSMLGGSAIRMAQQIKADGLNASVICVDPFTGDVNMWDWEKNDRIHRKWRFLRLDKGVPTIYKRFLANIANNDLSDVILPINTTSTVGMKLIERLNVQKRISGMPDYIYLDSAHEAGETLFELKMAWHVLKSGGVLFGDDWSWDAVRNDVIEFAKGLDNVNKDLLVKLCEALPGSQIVESNIVLWNGQWILVKD